MVFTYLSNAIYSIQTQSVIFFLKRWTAIVSILIVFTSIAITTSNLLDNTSHSITKTKTPSIYRNIPQKSIINDYWYFDGIGISGATTNFGEMLSPIQIAEKCKLFNNKCLGFDSKGSLFLDRDKGIAKLQHASHHQPLKGGFYLSGSLQSKEMCDKLKGGFNSTQRTCTNFNRNEIIKLQM